MERAINPKSFVGILTLTLIAVTAGMGQAVTFHVSPQGNDAWSGRHERPNQDRTDGPLASLRARSRIT